MASAYSGALDSLPTNHVDNVDEPIDALDINNIADAINKIEAELGTTPKGTYANVRLRLNAATRHSARNGAHGYQGEAFDILGGSGSGAPTTQVLFGSSVYLYKNEVVTNIITNVAVAGAGTAPTTIRLGIADNTNVVRAVTGNLNGNAAWTSTGMKSLALSSAYTVPNDGLYYYLFLKNGAFTTTDLSLVRGVQLATAGAALGANLPRFGQFGGAVTDIPAVGVAMGAFAANAINFWFAFS